MNPLIALRKQMKKKKPSFLRQEAHKKKKVPKNWRHPKGIHSKMRHGIRGHRKKLQVGYGSPAAVKHLHQSGLALFPISCMNDIRRADPAKHILVISGAVGMRKKNLLVKEAQKLNFQMVNVQDANAYVKMVDEAMQKRKQERKAAKTRIEEKKKEVKEKKEKPIEEKVAEATEEEKKEAEKKELDKALIRKEK